jgi:precorrin-6B methylase 2
MMLRAAACAVAAWAVAAHAIAQTAGTTPPFVTTPPEVVERMLAMAQTRKDDVIMDLGAGDGRIVIAAAKKYGARGIGVELDPKLVVSARENARAAGVEQLTTFVEGDVLKADLSGASVITAYLLPWLIDALQPRFLAELAPGTRIVSHAFAMSGWEPDETQTMHLTGEFEGRTSTLYLWVVPAQVRGEWRAAQPEGEWQLEIGQNFQQIDVEGTMGEAHFKASSARLHGRQIEWESDAGNFSGRVLTFQIVGTLTANGTRRTIVYARQQ